MPQGPIERDPTHAYPGLNREMACRMLDQAIETMELGTYDRQTINHLKDDLDQSTIVVLAGLLRRSGRARNTGPSTKRGPWVLPRGRHDV